MGSRFSTRSAVARLRPAAVLLAVVLLAGCDAQQQQQARDAAGSIASSAPAALGDVGVAAQIEAALVRIDADSSLHVAISVHDGAVRLSGRVKSTEIASRFEAAAKAVSGVKSVTADLTSDPHLPRVSQQARDAGTVAAVTGDLIAQTGVNAFRVKVRAHAGAVTLTGDVKSDAVKQSMLDAARHAPGVKTVEDHLSVKAL
jgi:osmotically-inducible protein OsmY